MPDTRTFTEEEYCNAFAIAGFIGAYRFWFALQQDHCLDGEKLLRQFGRVVWEKCGRKSTGPQTSQEAEAFRYCGLTRDN